MGADHVASKSSQDYPCQTLAKAYKGQSRACFNNGISRKSATPNFETPNVLAQLQYQLGPAVITIGGRMGRALMQFLRMPSHLVSLFSFKAQQIMLASTATKLVAVFVVGVPLCLLGGVFYSWTSGKSIVDGIINAVCPRIGDSITWVVPLCSTCIGFLKKAGMQVLQKGLAEGSIAGKDHAVSHLHCLVLCGLCEHSLTHGAVGCEGVI